MARISGVDIPKDKCIKFALTYIYGIGEKTADKICAECKVDPTIRTKDVPEAKINEIRTYIDKNLKTEGDLRRQVSLDIKRLTESVVIVVSVIVKVYQFVVNQLNKMRVRVKVQRKWLSGPRHKELGGNKWQKQNLMHR